MTDQRRLGPNEGYGAPRGDTVVIYRGEWVEGVPSRGDNDRQGSLHRDDTTASCRETGNLAKDSGHIREQDQFGQRVHNGEMLRGRAIVDQ